MVVNSEGIVHFSVKTKNLEDRAEVSVKKPVQVVVIVRMVEVLLVNFDPTRIRMLFLRTIVMLEEAVLVIDPVRTEVLVQVNLEPA